MTRRRPSDDWRGTCRNGLTDDGRALAGDDRGVSVTLTHVLVLAITTMLVGGVLVAANGLVDGQRDRAASEQLSVVGERLATELQRVDGLAAADPNASVTLRTDHRRRVVGSTYTVSLTTAPGTCSAAACLVLTVGDPEASTVVPVANRTDVAPATVTGGAVRVVYNGTALTVEAEGSA